MNTAVKTVSTRTTSFVRFATLAAYVSCRLPAISRSTSVASSTCAAWSYTSRRSVSTLASSWAGASRRSAASSSRVGEATRRRCASSRFSWTSCSSTLGVERVEHPVLEPLELVGERLEWRRSPGRRAVEQRVEQVADAPRAQPPVAAAHPLAHRLEAPARALLEGDEQRPAHDDRDLLVAQRGRDAVDRRRDRERARRHVEVAVEGLGLGALPDVGQVLERQRVEPAAPRRAPAARRGRGRRRRPPR